MTLTSVPSLSDLCFSLKEYALQLGWWSYNILKEHDDIYSLDYVGVPSLMQRCGSHRVRVMFDGDERVSYDDETVQLSVSCVIMVRA